MAAEESLGREPEEKINRQNRAVEDSDRAMIDYLLPTSQAL